jgi:lipopolysaccharide export system permease protein
MMRTLPRHILLELSKMFVVLLLAIIPLMIIQGLVRNGMEFSLPPKQILLLIPYVLPDALRFAVPVTMLLAATSVYSRMAGTNEVVAVKSMGIPPTAIVWPAIVLAFLLSLVTTWLNDVAVSWGRNGAERVIVEGVEDIAYGMLRTQGGYSSSKFDVMVKRVEGHVLIGTTLSMKRRDAQPITITADTAELISDYEKGALKIILRNATVRAGKSTLSFFDEAFELELPFHEASRAEGRSNHPSNIALNRIPGKIVEQEEKIDSFRQELATRAAYEMLNGDFDLLTNSEWDTRYRQLKDMQDRLHRLRTEPYRRWSTGFSCLFFVWVGAPLAIRLRNRDFLTSFFLCFAPILGVYYPALMWTVDGAKNGSFPPYAVWVGNLLLLAWGGWLLRRVIRY